MDRLGTNAELMKGGAHHVGDGEGNFRLEVTKDQVDSAKKEMEEDLEKK